MEELRLSISFLLHSILFNINFRNPNLISFIDIHDPEYPQCISEQILTKDFATSWWLINCVLNQRQCLGDRIQAQNVTIQPLPLAHEILPSLSITLIFFMVILLNNLQLCWAQRPLPSTHSSPFEHLQPFDGVPHSFFRRGFGKSQLLFVLLLFCKIFLFISHKWLWLLRCLSWWLFVISLLDGLCYTSLCSCIHYIS